MGLYGLKVNITLNIWINPMKYSSYWDDGVLEFYQLTIHTDSKKISRVLLKIFVRIYNNI